MKKISMFLLIILLGTCLESCGAIVGGLAGQGLEYVDESASIIKGTIEIRAAKPTYKILSNTCSNEVFMNVGASIADTISSLVASALSANGILVQKGSLIELPSGPYDVFTTENYSDGSSFYLKGIDNQDLCNTEGFIFVKGSAIIKNTYSCIKDHSISKNILKRDVDYTIILFPIKFWYITVPFIGKGYASEYVIGIYDRMGRLVAVGKELRSVNNDNVNDLIIKVSDYMSENISDLLRSRNL